MMFGAILKSYYAQTKGINPKDIYVVSIMPCVAKKEEKERKEMIKNEIKDVDAVLTTRELGRLIKLYGIDFAYLDDEEYDQDMFGEYTGAGVDLRCYRGRYGSRITYRLCQTDQQRTG
jgi:NADP-reducing hydrogenase subunit HndD